MGSVNWVVKLAITFGASGHLRPWSLQASGMGGTKGMVAGPNFTVTLLVRSLIATSVAKQRLRYHCVFLSTQSNSYGMLTTADCHTSWYCGRVGVTNE